MKDTRHHAFSVNPALIIQPIALHRDAMREAFCLNLASAAGTGGRPAQPRPTPTSRLVPPSTAPPRLAHPVMGGRPAQPAPPRAPCHGRPPSTARPALHALSRAAAQHSLASPRAPHPAPPRLTLCPAQHSPPRLAPRTREEPQPPRRTPVRGPREGGGVGRGPLVCFPGLGQENRSE